MTIDVFQKSRSYVTRLYKQIISSRFAQNFFIVASGTALAEVVKVAASPIITRLYGPESFGVLGTFTALVFILTPLTALSYPISIVLPKDDHEGLGLAGVSILSSLAIVVIISFLLFFGGNLVVDWLNLFEIRSFLILIPLMLITVTGVEIGQQWLFRKKNFQITSRLLVVQAVILNLTMIGVGLFYPYPSVLIITTVVVNAIYALLFLLQVKKNSGGVTISELKNKLNFFELAKRYRDFPFYRTPQRFINAISQNLPALLLASLFGPGAVAFYTLGRKVLVLPSMLIGDAMSRVFYPHITELARNDYNVTKSLIKTTASLALMGIVPFGIVVAFGPSLFSFVFGSEWIKGGEYARWLAIFLYFAFLNRPSVAAIPVLSIQGFFLVYEVVGVIFRAIAMYVGFFVYSDDTIAIILYSLAGVLLNIVLIMYVITYSRKAQWRRES